MPEPGPRIAAGREATIYEWTDGRVLRLFLREGAEADAGRELDALRSAAPCLRVPEAYELVQHDGHAGIVMERINGIDLLTDLERKPWRAYAAGTTLGRLHVRMLRCRAEAAVPSVHERMQHRLRQSGATPSWLLALAAQLLDGLPKGDALGHGDFHPGNIIASPTGPVVIDWPNATRGEPLADIATTRMLIALGELPEETPRAIRIAARGLRSVLLRAYDRAVGAAVPVDADRLRRWELLNAIARLTDGIPGEAPRLERYIRARIDIA